MTVADVGRSDARTSSLRPPRHAHRRHFASARLQIVSFQIIGGVRTVRETSGHAAPITRLICRGPRVISDPLIAS